LEINCRPAGPEEFGELVSAYLMISADLIPARLLYNLSASGKAETVQLVVGGRTTDEENDLSFNADYDIALPGQDQVVSGQEVYIMRCNDRENVSIMEILVLRQGDELGSCERIGRGTLCHAQWFKDIESPTIFKFL
jgi:hypothetical protein